MVWLDLSFSSEPALQWTFKMSMFFLQMDDGVSSHPSCLLPWRVVQLVVLMGNLPLFNSLAVDRSEHVFIPASSQSVLGRQGGILFPKLKTEISVVESSSRRLYLSDWSAILLYRYNRRLYLFDSGFQNYVLKNFKWNLVLQHWEMFMKLSTFCHNFLQKINTVPKIFFLPPLQISLDQEEVLGKQYVNMSATASRTCRSP